MYDTLSTEHPLGLPAGESPQALAHYFTVTQWWERLSDDMQCVLSPSQRLMLGIVLKGMQQHHALLPADLKVYQAKYSKNTGSKCCQMLSKYGFPEIPSSIRIPPLWKLCVCTWYSRRHVEHRFQAHTDRKRFTEWMTGATDSGLQKSESSWWVYEY